MEELGLSFDGAVKLDAAMASCSTKQGVPVVAQVCLER